MILDNAALDSVPTLTVPYERPYQGRLGAAGLSEQSLVIFGQVWYNLNFQIFLEIELLPPLLGPFIELRPQLDSQ